MKLKPIYRFLFVLSALLMLLSVASFFFQMYTHAIYLLVFACFVLLLINPIGGVGGDD